MERIESTPSIPFRSKKPSLQGTPKKPANLLQEDLPAMLETPEKSSRPPRVRNTNMALSIKDVKRTAQLLRKRDLNRSDLGSDPLESPKSVSDLQMQVPEKARRGAAKSVEGSVKLPEKYLMLCEFFNVMVSVIPLLRMRRMSLTFSNICSKIQSMTDRRFTINHLAQLKYILPEAILVKRIRLRDEKTDCMKEELLITLDMEAVKVSKNVNDIKEMFRARIKDYYEAHSEEDDIPEGELPAMFYQPNQSETSSINKSSCVASASHVPRSFQRSFSRKASVGKSADQSILGNPTAQLEKSLVSESSLMSTPIKANSVVIKDGFEGSIGIQGTPIKEAFTPIRLMASTPAVKPSKRSYMSPEDDKCDVPTKLIRRANRTRSLKFDPDEDNTMNEVQADDASGSNLDSDVTDLVPRNLLQSVREKERKILEEQDPAISQARRRHQLMSSLPKLFDMIHLLFQSINRSVLTKEELMFKIITCRCDIVDRGEIEEQLQLLLELAPEYLSERLCSSGDTLVRLNKSINAQSVRAKLLQA